MENKEILDMLEDLKKVWEFFYISDRERKMIIDYITNLQKKYDEANYDRHKLFEEKQNLKKINEEHHRINGELRKENEELKEVLDKIKEKLNQYEFISGYYDDNYDGEDTTYSHDTLKEDILNLLEGIE